jgi:hypothetical protein
MKASMMPTMRKPQLKLFRFSPLALTPGNGVLLCYRMGMMTSLLGFHDVSTST